MEITVTNEEVLNLLIQTKLHKAVGPDGVDQIYREHVQNSCTGCYAICLIYRSPTILFQLSGKCLKLLLCQKQPITVGYSLRPVTLASCVTRVFERIVLVYLQEQVAVIWIFFSLLTDRTELQMTKDGILRI